MTMRPSRNSYHGNKCLAYPVDVEVEIGGRLQLTRKMLYSFCHGHQRSCLMLGGEGVGGEEEEEEEREGKEPKSLEINIMYYTLNLSSCSRSVGSSCDGTLSRDTVCVCVCMVVYSVYVHLQLP